VATATAEDRTQQDASLRPGQLLDGKYRVDYLLGQGGMAAVWAGTNVRTGKWVALKVLLPALSATPGVDALFQREAWAASRVNHPNVVTVFDVIQNEGAACIVMELLTGESLDIRLAREGRLSLAEAYGLLLPAMRGVSAAHAEGVIHRDLKPQNIFICVGPDGRAVTTKVLDFGISLIRAVDSPLAGAPMPMGTPAYMAPEQIAGEALDERADVYGFGVLFYEALAGRLPFLGDPGAALYQCILYEQAPPLAELRPDLPAGILQAIDTALAKDPERRHANVDAMIGALEMELMPATPLPGAHAPGATTPQAGAAEATHSARATPQVSLGREPSGEHQATRFLVGFPLSAQGTPAHVTEPPPRRPAAWGHWLSHSRLGQSLASVAVTALMVGLGFTLWPPDAGLPQAGGDHPSTPPQAARPVGPVVSPYADSPRSAAAPDGPDTAATSPRIPAASPDIPASGSIRAAAAETETPVPVASSGKAHRKRDKSILGRTTELALRDGATEARAILPAARRGPTPAAILTPRRPGTSSSMAAGTAKPRAGGLSTDDF
jgi:eukaryotic-like serine/threonine-protein kinase